MCTSQTQAPPIHSFIPYRPGGRIYLVTCLWLTRFSKSISTVPLESSCRLPVTLPDYSQMYYDKFIGLWQSVQSEMPHVGLLSAWAFPFTCLAALPQRVLAVAQWCALLWQGPVLAMLAKQI